MSQNKVVNGNLVRVTYEGEKDFDKYYNEVREVEVFKPSGEVDPETGEQLGVIEKKLIVKKIDIQEYLESQRDSVGVESYIRALALQGDDIADYHTEVDPEKVVDFSKMPDTLADVMMSGESAKAAFASLPSELRGNHTTIEGFLNDLSQEKIDAYLKSRIEALTPKSEGGAE